MNETGHNNRHSVPLWRGRAGVRWGAVAAVLIAASLWALLGGCADPRNEPLAPRSPGYTETIVLWNNTVSGGAKLTAPFTVDQPLAPIGQLGEDHPARLTIVAYIHPDAQILRREAIVLDTLPALNDSLIVFQVNLFALEFSLDSALIVDSLCRIDPNCGYDTTGIGAFIAACREGITLWSGKITQAAADTTRLGLERDSLGIVLDDRYRLAIWMDDDTTTRYPEATFTEDFLLRGQAIYAASTGDTTTPVPGLKGRGFQLNLDAFLVADPVNPGRSMQVNWTQCFVGLELPCMDVGSHTMHAMVTGADSRITATLVLVYEEVTQ